MAGTSPAMTGFTKKRPAARCHGPEHVERLLPAGYLAMPASLVGGIRCWLSAASSLFMPKATAINWL